MARTEFYSEGTIPLQTLRATTLSMDLQKQIQHMEKVGVKVWIYKGRSTSS